MIFGLYFDIKQSHGFDLYVDIEKLYLIMNGDSIYF